MRRGRRVRRLGGILLAMTVACPVAANDLTVWRGAIHVHSLLSHDSCGTFPEIARAAREAGLNFVMLTDHPGPGVPEGQPRGVVNGIRFVPGVELNHLLGLGVDHAIDEPDLGRAIAAIHRQNGLAIVAHPRGFRHWNVRGFDGMEVYDLFDDIQAQYFPIAIPRWFLTCLVRDSGREMSDILDRPALSVARWDRATGEPALVGIGTVDAHLTSRAECRVIDPYAMAFRHVQTWVEAPSCSTRDLLAALRNGRAEIVLAGFGNPGWVRFAATDVRRTVMTGGDLAPAGTVTFSIAIRHGAEVRLVKDGAVVWTRVVAAGPARLTVPASGAGRYRVELWTRRGSRSVPWLLTNPIRIEETLEAGVHDPTASGPATP